MVDVNMETVKETGVTLEDIKSGIKVVPDDVVDGCYLTTDIQGYDATQTFFLDGGTIVESAIEVGTADSAQ